MAIRSNFSRSSAQAESEEQFRDLGFGTKGFAESKRLINQDGSFNVRKQRKRRWRLFDTYHDLITMSWLAFMGWILIVYLGVNLMFALLYVLIGMDQLTGIIGLTWAEQVYDAFFFSTQTITTLGYGRVSPVGFWSGLVAALESLIGLLGFALITGLLYGRFSRPFVRILFSEFATIAPYRDMTAFEFRIANERNNQLIEVEVQVVYTRYDPELQQRNFYNLPLERNKVNFLSLSWTIVHPIDEKSPLSGLSEQEFYKADGEFLILIRAFDDTFSQTVYARSSYKNYETRWGKRFQLMFDEGEGGAIDLFLDKIHDME